jgi:catechol 2,3-dioxygenase-like lactoylglutathione lyase family enzyme
MRILELNLRTRWLDKVESFYRDILEFPVTSDGSRCTVRAGWSELHFKQDDSGEAPFYHFAFNIPPGKLDEAHNWLRHRTSLLSNEKGDRFYFPFWDAEAVYIEDPSGNIVEFIARSGTGTPSDEPFSGASALCISEVGLPVQEFSALDRSLRRQLGIRHYFEPTDDISIIGDADASLVLVRDRRGWMPTGREAEIHPLEIRLSGESNAHVSFAMLPYRITMERDA